ncbi:unnamed protein product [Microthlaspi erraticum]|uniref:Phosphoglycerate kinase n=1 Tax=Microthlaspi erraticum TaxID=1685480 RepID=A0A6D2HKL4_9BRAS|nr:unnamed protein product [Microthlaspi erraticum]
MESPFKPEVLKGKVALITGGGSGIGFEISSQFGKHGASIAIMGRRKQVLDDAVSALRSLGISAIGLEGDVRKQEDAKRVVESTFQHFGRIDILVNSAAGNFLASAEDLTPNGFRTVMDIDAVGTFTMCHAALKYLKKGGPGRDSSSSGGSILNISATLHYTASWYQIHVSAAKAAVDATTRNLALEWGTDYDIRVNGIAPGPIAGTPGMSKLVPEEIESKAREYMPLYKLGEKWDIAMAALYLSCDSGKFVNGLTMAVDRGLWLSKPRHLPKEAVKELSRVVEKRSRAKPVAMASTAASSTFSLLKSTGVVASSAATRARASLLPVPFKSVSARPLGFSAVVDSRFSVHVASKVQSVRGKGTRGVVSMAKKSVGDLTSADLKGKKVFVRADLNVPLDDNQTITDDTRIRAAIPTIKYLIDNGAKVILSTHLGRPKGVTPKFSLAPLVPRLSELLGIEVKKADDCIGPEVESLVAALPEGGVLLLENVRFYKEEEKNDPEFAKKLAALADLYVNDAFGTAHRAHASTEGVTKFLKPSVAGFLLQKELDYLVGAVSNPKRPFAAIVGGSKVSSKIGVIESLLEKCDILLLGGGMIFTFYKAQGLSVGSSLVEEDKLELATELLAKAKAKGVSLLLPTDVVVADKFAPDANSKIVPASGIEDGWMGLDIGPDSIKTFNEALDTTQTVIWNGPMGVFEMEKFAAGTEAIANKLAELSEKGVTTIIGGGDSVAAVEKVGVAGVMSHISTGGGASLELLEGKVLPGVIALDEAVPVTV